MAKNPPGKAAPLPKGKPPRKRGKRRPSARRVPPPAPTPQTTRIELLPAPSADLVPLNLDERAIEGDDIVLGNLGLVELKATEAEERILSEPPPIDRLRFLPQQHPVIYAPHTEYTRLFNRAFGRFGWQLVPVGRASFDLGKRCVVCPYVLHVHGRPVAAALGQQEYHEKNADQTFGDAVESTVASGLRRCAKRIGVWLELWDPDWKERMTRELGTCVTVKTRAGEERKQWRRKDDPPFYNEVGGGSSRRRDPNPPPPAQTSSYDNPDGDKPIGEVAARKLWETARRHQRSDHEVIVWLGARYGVKESAAIRRKDYNAIVAALEAPGPLPLPTSTRQPGEEG